jgi:hypothetical protein
MAKKLAFRCGFFLLDNEPSPSALETRHCGRRSVITGTSTFRANYGGVLRDGDKTFSTAGGANEGFDRP